MHEGRASWPRLRRPAALLLRLVRDQEQQRRQGSRRGDRAALELVRSARSASRLDGARGPFQPGRRDSIGLCRRVITRLDRLGRSVLHLVSLGAELRERGVGLHVIPQGIDTTSAEGRAVFGMLSVLAELQRELIGANTRDGLAGARARGRNGARRPRLNSEQVTLA